MNTHTVLKYILSVDEILPKKGSRSDCIGTAHHTGLGPGIVNQNRILGQFFFHDWKKQVIRISELVLCIKHERDYFIGVTRCIYFTIITVIG